MYRVKMSANSDFSNHFPQKLRKGTYFLTETSHDVLLVPVVAQLLWSTESGHCDRCCHSCQGTSPLNKQPRVLIVILQVTGRTHQLARNSQYSQCSCHNAGNQELMHLRHQCLRQHSRYPCLVHTAQAHRGARQVSPCSKPT